MGPTNWFFIYQRFLNCQCFTALHGNITMNEDLKTCGRSCASFWGIYRYLKEILGFWSLFIQWTSPQLRMQSATCHV
jgi:hypothetical protein